MSLQEIMAQYTNYHESRARMEFEQIGIRTPRHRKVNTMVAVLRCVGLHLR